MPYPDSIAAPQPGTVVFQREIGVNGKGKSRLGADEAAREHLLQRGGGTSVLLVGDAFPLWTAGASLSVDSAWRVCQEGPV